MRSNFIKEIKAGDVLLCYAKPSLASMEAAKDKVVHNAIRHYTGSAYSHAAISLGNGDVAEAIKSGVRAISLGDLLGRYDHIAVFRAHEGCWTPKNINSLNEFIIFLVRKQAKYNLLGLLNFYTKEKEKHHENLQEQLEDYFDGNLSVTSPDKLKYFCSELIVSCFHKVGIFSDSAAVLYRSDVYAPIDLTKDPTFGLFVGYLSKHDDYKVPDTDEFYNHNSD